jgi:hypothetical protein
MNKIICLLILFLSAHISYAQKTLSIGLSVERNYNATYRRVTPGLTYDAKDLAFMDTVHNPCFTNSIRASFEVKIWKLIGLKTGFSYGRKGVLSCQDTDAIYNHSTGNYTRRQYYFIFPIKTFSIPLMLTLKQGFWKEKFYLALSFGFEQSYRNGIEYNWESRYPHNLAGIKRGFWGFQPQKSIPETAVFYDDSTGPASLQYIFELQLKFKLFDNLFCMAHGIYLPDRKFSYTPYYLSTGAYYQHDVKFYTYSAGLGLSYSF